MEKNNNINEPILDFNSTEFDVLDLILFIKDFKSRDEFLKKTQKAFDDIEQSNKIPVEDKQKWAKVAEYVQKEENWSRIKQIKDLIDSGALKNPEQDLDEEKEI